MPNINPKPKPKPNPKIDDFTNEQICKMKSKILLIKSELLCEIINLEIEDVELLNIDFEEKESKCGGSKNSVTLVGYYIKPKYPILNLPDPPKSSNRLDFFPVWLHENSNHFTEFVGSSWPSPTYTVGNGIEVPIGCNADLVVQIINANSATFDHSDFQFSSYYPKFDRAFISRHELFMIMQYSEYIGIVGARVSSGNYVVVDTDDSGELSLKDCNKNYFTYRFIGFNSATCTGLQEKQIALKRADRSRNKRNKSSDGNGNDNDFEHTIPAESWALPCPPRWRSQEPQ